MVSNLKCKSTRGVLTSRGLEARDRESASGDQEVEDDCGDKSRDSQSLQAHRHLQILAHLASKSTRYIGLFGVRHHHEQRRGQTDTMVNRFLGCLLRCSNDQLGRSAWAREFG